MGACVQGCYRTRNWSRAAQWRTREPVPSAPTTSGREQFSRQQRAFRMESSDRRLRQHAYAASGRMIPQSGADACAGFHKRFRGKNSFRRRRHCPRNECRERIRYALGMVMPRLCKATTPSGISPSPQACRWWYRAIGYHDLKPWRRAANAVAAAGPPPTTNTSTNSPQRSPYFYSGALASGSREKANGQEQSSPTLQQHEFRAEPRAHRGQQARVPGAAGDSS